MKGFDEKEFNETSAEKIHRNKPRPVNGQPTKYLAQVIDAEEKNGYKGYSILLHYQLVEAPKHPDASPVGMKFAFVSQPTKVEEKSKKLEMAKIKRAFGAPFGLDERESSSLTLAAINKCFRVPAENGQPARPSPLRGRIVEIMAHPYAKKGTGAASSFWDAYPHLVNGQPVDRPIDISIQAEDNSEDEPETSTASAPPAPPAAPSAPAAPPPPDNLARAVAEGWQPHPTAPGCYFKGSVSKWEAELRAGNF